VTIARRSIVKNTFALERAAVPAEHSIAPGSWLTKLHETRPEQIYDPGALDFQTCKPILLYRFQVYR